MRAGSIMAPTTIGDAAMIDPSWNAEAMSWIGSMVGLPTPYDTGMKGSSWENERSLPSAPEYWGRRVGTEVKTSWRWHDPQRQSESFFRQQVALGKAPLTCWGVKAPLIC